MREFLSVNADRLVSLSVACVALAITPRLSQAQTWEGPTYQARYVVSEEAPRVERLGEFGVTRLHGRVLLSFTGAKHQLASVFTPYFTLCTTSRFPSQLGFLFPPEATGRVAFVPLILRGVVPWNVTEATDTGHVSPMRTRVEDLDAVSVQGAHVMRVADVYSSDSSTKTDVVQINVYDGNDLRDTWAFADYRAFGGIRLPGAVTRTKHRLPRIGVKTEQRVTWRMESFGAADAQDLQDSVVLSQGASIQDNRNLAQPAHFRFLFSDGSLDDQAARAAKSRLAEVKPSPSESIPAIVALISGLCMGATAVRRRGQTSATSEPL